MCALTGNRKFLAVEDSLVTLNLDFASEIGSDFTSQIAFNLKIGFNELAKFGQLWLLEIFDAGLWTDASCR